MDGKMKSASQALKLKLTLLPKLAFPQFQKTFSVETDVSVMEIGAVLLRIKKTKFRSPFRVPALK